MALPYPGLLLVLVGLIFTWVLTRVFHSLKNPLNKVPGPWYAKWTNLRLKVANISGRHMHYVDDLHKRYGPVVRLSPDEVAVADPEAFLQIHKVASGFNKSNWYLDLVPFPRPTAFTMTDPKQHSARRKLLARGFSKSYLRQTWEPVVRAKVELTVTRMKEEAESGATDVLKWWTLMATDVSTHLMFGNSFQMLEHGKVNKYIRTLQNALQGSGISVELPFVRLIGNWVPTETFAEMFRSTPFLMEYATRAIRGNRERGDMTSIFSKIIREAEKGETLDELDVTLEATGLIVAGSDTTGISLTYLIWAVLSRPEIREALEQEVSVLPDLFTDEDLEKLPFLNATIEETLRLYGAAPGGLPRSVPPEGATIAGYHLPGGTTVTTQAYTIHRDEKIFPHPLVFDPYRWLMKDDPQTTPERVMATKISHPFGAGSRTCLGIHLAQMELRLAVAEFFRKCKGARLATTTTPASMEMENYFLVAPRSHRCEIEIGKSGSK